MPSRISFHPEQPTARRLPALEYRTGARSQAEVVRRALRVYEWLVEQQERGGLALEVTDLGSWSTSVNLRNALGLDGD